MQLKSIATNETLTVDINTADIKINEDTVTENDLKRPKVINV
jgi:hypothetical protein